MATNFWGARFPTISPVIQQIKVGPSAVQLPAQTQPNQGVTAIPVKNVAFQQAILSHALFNVGRNGPVLTGDTVAFYDDRFDANKKWYFPRFSLQTPLQNSFLLTCWISG